MSLARFPTSSLVFVKKISSGGQATVDLYHHPATNMHYAVKDFGAGATPKVRAILEEEAVILNGLRHPHVVAAVGIVVSEGTADTPRLVMEYTPNGTLFDALHATPPPPFAVRMRWATELALALAYLHDNGVLHRDLKSLNCLLDGDNRIKVCDFGSAKMFEASTTIHTTSAATIKWSAPETFDDAYSLACDIYSYAIVLWELLTLGWQVRQVRDESCMCRLRDPCYPWRRPAGPEGLTPRVLAQGSEAPAAGC